MIFAKSKPAYIGIFLDPASRRRLLREVPPLHRDVRADHVTVVFRPTDEDLGLFNFGEKIRLQAVGVAEDSKAQAVLVRVPRHLGALAQRRPHITVSVAPGTEPAYSNRLIDREVDQIPPFTLMGELDAYPRNSMSRLIPSFARVAVRYLRKMASVFAPPG